MPTDGDYDYNKKISDWECARRERWRQKYKALGLKDWEIQKIINKRIWRGD